MYVIQNASKSLLDFADISVGTKSTLTEIDDYLARAVENVKNPLKWWQDNRAIYPDLSWMAADYVSIPSRCHFIVLVGVMLTIILSHIYCS